MRVTNKISQSFAPREPPKSWVVQCQERRQSFVRVISICLDRFHVIFTTKTGEISRKFVTSRRFLLRTIFAIIIVGVLIFSIFKIFKDFFKFIKIAYFKVCH